MSEVDTILAQIDDAIDDWTVSPDAVRFNAPPDALPVAPPRFPGLTVDPVALARFSVRVEAAFEGFRKAMEQVAQAVNKIAENPEMRRLLGLPVYDEHHPRPLCIDGAAYARRRKARKRR